MAEMWQKYHPSLANSTDWGPFYEDNTLRGLARSRCWKALPLEELPRLAFLEPLGQRLPDTPAQLEEFFELWGFQLALKFEGGQLAEPLVALNEGLRI